MSDERLDILHHYQNISNKLRKKRILKKPNVAEAGQQFENLGKICEREDLEQYAGLSYQAAAKCQNSLGNHLEEGLLLLKSSKQFMSSYLKLLKNESVLNETYLHYSYTIYRECLARLKDNKEQSELVSEMIMGSIALEMGKDLKEKIGMIEEGCQEYKKSLNFFSKSPAERINCLQKLVIAYIELGKISLPLLGGKEEKIGYDGKQSNAAIILKANLLFTGYFNESLKFLDDIVKAGESLPDSGLKSDILRNAEITRIFLLLILQPTPQQISAAAASTLAKYAWVETSNSSEIKDLESTLNNEGLSMLSENLFLKLQSLVMACQYGDVEVLTFLESDLLPYLSIEQKILLKILIKQYLM